MIKSCQLQDSALCAIPVFSVTETISSISVILSMVAQFAEYSFTLNRLSELSVQFMPLTLLKPQSFLTGCQH